MSHPRRSTILPALALAALAASVLQAGEGEFPTFKFSGFASLVGGRITHAPSPGLSPDPETAPPMYIADWSN